MTVRQQNIESVPLCAIAEIFSGYHFRGKVEPDESGNALIIQVRDLDDRRQLDLNQLTRAQIPKPAEYAVQSGDVLFLTRGYKPHGVVVHQPPASCVPTSYFLVLRADQQRVLPEYLAWVLNSPAFQSDLMKATQGTVMAVVSKKRFENLPIALPDLETQQKIVGLFTLLGREKELTHQLLERREKLLHQSASKILQKESHGEIGHE